MLQPQGAFGVSPYEEGKRRRQTFHVQRFREKHAHLPVLQLGRKTARWGLHSLSLSLLSLVLSLFFHTVLLLACLLAASKEHTREHTPPRNARSRVQGLFGVTFVCPPD